MPTPIFDETVAIVAIDPQTKEVLKTFETLKKAALYTGIPRTTLGKICSQRGRAYSTVYKKEIACRVLTENLRKRLSLLGNSKN